MHYSSANRVETEKVEVGEHRRTPGPVQRVREGGQGRDHNQALS